MKDVFSGGETSKVGKNTRDGRQVGYRVLECSFILTVLFAPP